MQDGFGISSRLIALGLAYNINGFSRNPITNSMSFNPSKNDVGITEFGKKFYQYGIVG